MSLSLMELETAINRGDDEVLSEGVREEEMRWEEERGEREGESLIVGCLNLLVRRDKGRRIIKRNKGLHSSY